MRVPKAGSERGQPAWCGFRDEIRSQRLAARAATIAGPSDGLTLQLTVFGQHEAQTLAQMHACLTVGRATAGVLCADGHLGYAQPIGGVIAYQGQVSVSGVGFDCGNLAARLDVRLDEIRHRGRRSWPTSPATSPSASAAPMRSGWSMPCSTTAPPGRRRAWSTTGRRRAPSSAPWARATIMWT